MPGQLPAEGVTVIVPVIGVDPGLVAVNAGTFPLPLAPSPMAVLLFVHINVVPGVEDVKFVAGTVAPIHTTILAGTITFGAGLTVMVYVDEVPVQPLIEGVTVMVAMMGVAPGLVAVNEGTFPFPLAPSPIAVLLFVHENVAPGVVLVKLVAGTVAPLQTTILAGTITVGIGLTVMV
jgi:hypothetical protein